VRAAAAITGLFLLATPCLAFQAPQTIIVPAGDFIYGSDQQQREYGYQLDEKAYGHSITREQGWYDREAKRQIVKLPAFAITKTAITNSQYAVFLSQTVNRRPWVGADTWADYGLAHPYARAQRHNWRTRVPPQGRETHPVVLVSYEDAVAYAKWLSEKTGQKWSLPDQKQWEKAARGTDGRYFPWGDAFDKAKLNSHDAGPFDTMPVGSFPKGKSPYGVMDMAGQVFEWTSTPAGKNRHVVKGGSWDDKGCGVCRSAAWHTRPNYLKHILVGFRLVHPVQ
jgi:formylglycine-generating enzyme required for sulfatase activity